MSPPVRAPRRLRSTGDLRALQRLMAAAVMRPLTAASRTQRRWNDGRPAAAVIGSFIKPNDRLGAVERLEIYNRMYWFRLLDCLLEDFPGVRAVLGERRFLRLAEAYLVRHPSRSFTLRNLGRGLAEFIRAEPRRTAPRTVLAGDMARFEWAQVEAFDGEARPALTPAEIAGVNPARLRLGLQPYLSLLTLDYAVDDLVLAVKKDALRGDASNAPEAAPTARRSRPVRLPRRERVFLAVHRYQGTLYFKRLEPAAARLLTLLQAGRTLARACAEALPPRTAASPAQQRRLQAWFQNWAALGWFCRR
ncbi:MAG TPA: DNA-binding domain-containing protein [Opitutaceae bacterium]|nr:DNA-binding domain-containing protein [Opitutaceae bacterium]